MRRVPRPGAARGVRGRGYHGARLHDRAVDARRRARIGSALAPAACPHGAGLRTLLAQPIAWSALQRRALDSSEVETRSSPTARWTWLAAPAARRDRRAGQRGEIDAGQSALRAGALDHGRPAGHDARLGRRDREHRRSGRDAGRHAGPAPQTSDAIEAHAIELAAGRSNGPTWSCSCSTRRGRWSGKRSCSSDSGCDSRREQDGSSGGVGVDARRCNSARSRRRGQGVDELALGDSAAIRLRSSWTIERPRWWTERQRRHSRTRDARSARRSTTASWRPPHRPRPEGEGASSVRRTG